MLTLFVVCVLNVIYFIFLKYPKLSLTYIYLLIQHIYFGKNKNSCYMVHWLGIAGANAKRQCSLKLLVRAFFQSTWGWHKPAYFIYITFSYVSLVLAKQYTHEQYANNKLYDNISVTYRMRSLLTIRWFILYTANVIN